MRLTTEQIRIIKETIARFMGENARVVLFGSRVDDRKRGGDIDLYVETDKQEYLQELRCKISLEEALDLHVDMIVRKPGQNHPIYNIAKSEGVRL
jgi:predicted nucleotidyltransferase